MGTVMIPTAVTNVNNFIGPYPLGTQFLFEPGTHYLSEPLIPRTGDKYVGSILRGKRASILSGAVALRHWQFSGSFWIAGIPPLPAFNVPDVCRADSPNCNDPYDVYIDNELQKKVATLEELEPGTVLVDYTLGNIVLGSNPKGNLVEVCRTPYLFLSGIGINDIVLEDLIVEKFATPTGRGAVNLGASAWGSTRWEVNSCEVRYNHGGGIMNDAETMARYNYVHHNGGFGFFGAGWNILIEGNEISFNNTCGYNPYWGAGGSKWVFTTDLVVRGNYSHHNRGPGLWTDINNKRTLYENNIVEDNELSGIFHEISYEATIRKNKCRRNGWEHKWPYWTANAGICVVSSRNVVVHDNIVEYNWQGITGLDDGRGTGNDGPWVLENLQVHHNKVVTNQFQGDGTGRSGVVFMQQPKSFLFDNNHYDIEVGFEEPFFQNTDMTVSQWQESGQDVNSTFRWV